MLITFYHTGLCPRCAIARKHLKALLGGSYPRQVTEVDALVHPLETWRKGIRLVPALKAGTDILSGVMLSRSAIERFLAKHNGRQQQ